MCMYSLHARMGIDMRNAKVGENLTVGEYRGHAALVGDDGKLTCVKHGTVMRFDELMFAPGIATWIIMKYEGNPATVTFIEGNRREYGRHYAADCFKLEDGYVLPLHALRMGLVGRIPRKMRKDAGIAKPRNLDKAFGLDQIRADLPPDPKPEDERVPEPTPAEPTPAPVPEREPETVS